VRLTFLDSKQQIFFQWPSNHMHPQLVQSRGLVHSGRFNRLVCRVGRKNVMANEIAGFGDLNFFSYLSELIIECLIRLGKVLRILED
jgi:hypothetical protein